MSDLAETISVERDGLRDMLERLAVSREANAKVRVGGSRAEPYRCHRRETAARSH